MARISAGGEGPDALTGGAGADRLSGLGGTDHLRPETGSDDMDGGLGRDVVDYGANLSGVAVDLSIPGPQSKGGGDADVLVNVERVFGSSFADVLGGDDGPNQLYGGDGNDVLDGRGGPDTLAGRDGADTLDVRDGGPDSADCGADADTVTADLVGVDTLTACENVSFLTPPRPPGGGGSGAPPSTTGTGGSTTTGGPTTAGTGARDTLKPAFRGKVKAVPAQFEVGPKVKRAAAIGSAARGTRFHYRLSEHATVTVAIERRTTGRRVKGTCRRTTRSNAKRRRCVLHRRVGAFRAQGATGANRTPFSGRIGSRALAPGPYRGRLTAVDAAGNVSRPATVGFQLLKAKAKRP